MKKILIALSLGLASCATFNPSGPAPLAATSADEKTLIIALQTFDTVLTSIDRLVAAGVIKPGSPTALSIANAIHTAKVAYQAASAAQRVGNSASYYAAIAQASVAVAQINALVKGS